MLENGLVLALFAAVAFAVGAVYARKGVVQAGDTFTAVAVSVFIGLPFFVISTSISGEWDELWALSGQAVTLLGMAGIVHYVGGRLLSYTAYRLIGANKTSAFSMTTPFYTLIFGFVFLSETITISLVLGIIGIFIGAVLVSLEKKSVSLGGRGRFFRTEVTGIITALGGALCWGISPILIRPVVKEIGSPNASALVSYVAASIVMAGFLFRKKHREQLTQPSFFTALLALVISGFFNCVAHLFNFTALSYAPANVVTPIIGTNVIFLVFLSFLINRKIEVFTSKVIIGISATVTGTFLIFYF